MTGLVISLTTTPPRFPYIGKTLRDLLNQTAKVDEIRLNIPRRYRRFPYSEADLPKLPKGVRLCLVEEDFGPATKVLPAVADLAGQDVEILFCDDDQPYRPDWAAAFLRARAEQPDACIIEQGTDLDLRMPGMRYYPVRHPSEHRAVRRKKGLSYRLIRAATLTLVKPRPYIGSGLVDLLEGYRGALIRPDFLPPETFTIPDVLWTVDDIWLSGQLTRNGVPIWLNADTPRRGLPYAGHFKERLALFSHGGYDRENANTLCVEYFRRTYGIWPDRQPPDNPEAAEWPLPGPAGTAS